MGVRTLPSRVIGLTLVYVLCSKKCVATSRSRQTLPREILERLCDVSKVQRPPAVTATTDDNVARSFDSLHTSRAPLWGVLRAEISPWYNNVYIAYECNQGLKDRSHCHDRHFCRGCSARIVSPVTCGRSGGIADTDRSSRRAPLR